MQLELVFFTYRQFVCVLHHTARHFALVFGCSSFIHCWSVTEVVLLLMMVSASVLKANNLLSLSEIDCQEKDVLYTPSLVFISSHRVNLGGLLQLSPSFSHPTMVDRCVCQFHTLGNSESYLALFTLLFLVMYKSISFHLPLHMLICDCSF